MSAIGQALGGIAGGVIGLSAQEGDKGRAEQMYTDARTAQKGYNTQAAGVQGNAFDKVDPVSRAAMLKALADYQNKADQGGLDAKGRANLEAGQARAAQTAAQIGAQVRAGAGARGIQGPAAMIAQQVATQQAQEGARMNGLQSGAIAEDARNQALQGSMQAAGNVYGMDANKAAAANAINEFNVRNAQMNIGNNAHVADQLSGIDQNEAGTYEKRAIRDYKDYSGEGKELGGSAGGLVGGWLSGGGGGGAGLPVDAEGTGMGG